MKQTLSTAEAVELLRRDVYAKWSLNGARALVEWIEDYEETATGEEFEFDPVALRCDFSEFATAQEAAREYGYTGDNADALEWLQDHTVVIPFDGGVIVGSF